MQTIKIVNVNYIPDNFTGIAEDSNGTKIYYLNGKYHRENGPAVESSTGTRYYYLNGKRHREDGPAFEWLDGNKYYYMNNNFLIQTQTQPNK